MDMTDIGSNDDERVVRLDDAIRQVFPDENFTGRITPVDERWIPEVDDSGILYKALKGQKWTSISRQLLRDLPDGFVLLSDEAFVTFVAAWILESLRDTHTENEVRNYLAYSFENGKRQVSLLNLEQRAVLKAVLEEIARSAPSEFARKCAARAAANVL